jgi:hypothetical protein
MNPTNLTATASFLLLGLLCLYGAYVLLLDCLRRDGRELLKIALAVTLATAGAACIVIPGYAAYMTSATAQGDAPCKPSTT